VYLCRRPVFIADRKRLLSVHSEINGMLSSAMDLKTKQRIRSLEEDCKCECDRLQSGHYKTMVRTLWWFSLIHGFTLDYIVRLVLTIICLADGECKHNPHIPCSSGRIELAMLSTLTLSKIALYSNSQYNLSLSTEWRCLPNSSLSTTKSGDQSVISHFGIVFCLVVFGLIACIEHT